MSKEIIAVDVDEVLFPFIDEFINDHNDIYGTQLQLDQFTSYEFHDPLGLSIDESVKRIYDFLYKLVDMEVEPLQEAQDSIAKLSEKFDLVIVTARHSQFEQLTMKWLEEYFPSYFKDVVMIGWAPIMEKPLTKAEVCIDLGAIALIDDSLPHILHAVESGVEGVLFGNYPWNQTLELPIGAIRTESWPKVLEHFNV